MIARPATYLVEVHSVDGQQGGQEVVVPEPVHKEQVGSGEDHRHMNGNQTAVQEENLQRRCGPRACTLSCRVSKTS